MSPDDIGRVAGMVEELRAILSRHPRWDEVRQALGQLEVLLHSYYRFHDRLPGAKV